MDCRGALSSCEGDQPVKSTAQFSMGLERLAKPGDTRCRVSDELFAEICRIYPEGKGARSFFAKLPTDDSCFIALEALLKRSGYKFTNRFELETPRSAMLTVTVEYEGKDFGRHSWYEVYPSKLLAEYPSRNPQGLLRNLGDQDYPLSEEERKALLSKKIDEPPKKIPKWADSALATVGGSSVLLMGVGLAKDIEASGFIVPSKPTESAGIVEWNPRLVFPRLSARCQFCDPKGNATAPDADRACGFLLEGCIQSPILKYDRDAVVSITGAGGVDDIAKTVERFGNAPEVAEPALLVSRRLTEWLIKRDKKLLWKPVEIE